MEPEQTQDPPPPPPERRAGQQPLPPDTTYQDDITKAGQRKVNLIWEWTQAVIAVSVVVTNMIVGTAIGLGYSKIEYPLVLSNTMFLIVGFYFSRTNHQAIGGIGKKPAPEYEGR